MLSEEKAELQIKISDFGLTEKLDNHVESGQYRVEWSAPEGSDLFLKKSILIFELILFFF